MTVIFFELHSITWKNGAVTIWFRLRCLVWEPEVPAEWRCQERTWENSQWFCKARTSDQNMRQFSELCIMGHQNEKDSSSLLEDQRPCQELPWLCPIQSYGLSFGKFSLYGYSIFIVRVKQCKVCYWLIFVFYDYSCFTYIDCLCTLWYADAHLIHVKDCPYWGMW